MCFYKSDITLVKAQVIITSYKYLIQWKMHYCEASGIPSARPQSMVIFLRATSCTLLRLKFHLDWPSPPRHGLDIHKSHLSPRWRSVDAGWATSAPRSAFPTLSAGGLRKTLKYPTTTFADRMSKSCSKS